MNNVFNVYLLLDLRKPGRYTYSELGFSLLFEPFYAGKGKENRWFDHIQNAKNTDKNSYKLNKIRKILQETGQEPLVLKLKGNMSEDKAFDLEKLVIKVIGRYPNGPLCNLCDGGEGVSNPSEETRKKHSIRSKGNKSFLGRKHKPESIEKIRKSQKKRFENPAERERLSNMNKGRKRSPEFRKKNSDAHKGKIPWNKGKRGVQVSWSKGKKMSPEFCESVSKSCTGRVPWNKGIPCTEEAKEKNRIAHLGHIPWNKGIPCTEEQKERLREVNTGKKHLEKTKKKIGDKIIGRKESEETKRKKSEAMKEYYRKKKEMEKQCLEILLYAQLLVIGLRHLNYARNI